MSDVQIASLIVLALYLLAFFGGSALAARAAGQPIWLFGTARGRDRLAAIGFRASFVLALAGPLVAVLVPGTAVLHPTWGAGFGWVALAGHIIAVAGAMLAFAAQMAMGASWRVGVPAGRAAELVSGGLYTLSRNPTFLGQATLLGGVALSVPTLCGCVAFLLFLASAMVQIRSEEAALLRTHGEAFEAFRARTPRWIGLPRL